MSSDRTDLEDAVASLDGLAQIIDQFRGLAAEVAKIVDEKPALQVVEGNGERTPTHNIKEMRELYELAKNVGLHMVADVAPAAGDRITFYGNYMLNTAVLFKRHGYSNEDLLRGMILGAAQFAHANDLPTVSDWPNMLLDDVNKQE